MRRKRVHTCRPRIGSFQASIPHHRVELAGIVVELEMHRFPIDLPTGRDYLLLAIKEPAPVSGEFETERDYLEGDPVSLDQQNLSESNGYFGFGRAGLDYFMDNRNTLSLSGTFNRGNFKSDEDISTQTDSINASGWIIDSFSRILNKGPIWIIRHFKPAFRQ